MRPQDRSQFVKPQYVRSYFRKNHPDLRLSLGFLKYLDIYLESVFKRAAAQSRGRYYLNAPTAIMACRYAFKDRSARLEKGD